jgi:hypothetical protein
MDVPNIATTTTNLTESARRTTNVLLVELDRPPFLKAWENDDNSVISKIETDNELCALGEYSGR